MKKRITLTHCTVSEVLVYIGQQKQIMLQKVFYHNVVLNFTSMHEWRVYNMVEVVSIIMALNLIVKQLKLPYVAIYSHAMVNFANSQASLFSVQWSYTKVVLSYV